MKTQNKISPVPFEYCVLQGFLILGALLAAGILMSPFAAWNFSILFFSGWFSWTFLEYGIHRFLMHEFIIPGSSDKLFNHHEHHKSPNDLKVKPAHRLLSLIVFLIVFIFAWKIRGLSPAFAGLIFGIAIYNYLHYLLHQKFGGILLPKIQRAHILHHYNRPNHGFSFSTSFWDWLFHTLPPKEDKINPTMLRRYFSENKKR